MTTSPLPIDGHLKSLLDQLEGRGALVVVAEPGAGKTTRLPPALLTRRPGQVWVLEPRRLAARLAARRVAQERGEEVGGTVGYQVRFDSRAGRSTRLIYMTEGVLTRRLASGADLSGVSAVVLDELHERHAETDLALTLLDRLRRETRPDLWLVAMSATLDAQPVATFLDAPAADVPGRVHPVTIEHARNRDERRLEDRVQEAVSNLVADGLDGSVLVFLPGVGEIDRASRALQRLARSANLEVCPLHGRLGPDALETALRPSKAHKVILATNIAESSVTIDGVVAVVDSGLARVAGVAKGLPTLQLQPISRASATQRANRAGRQRPGRCLRLYTRVDHDRRPAAAVPELLRTDLAGPVLVLRAAGVTDLSTLRWLDPPGDAGLEAADALLRRLEALDSEGQLTPLGRRLHRYPLPPRLARVLDAGASFGVGPQVASAVALLSERDIRTNSRAAAETEEASDVLLLLDLFDEAAQLGFNPGRLRPLGVDPRSARAVDRVRRQLERLLPRQSPPPPDHADVAILKALLAGHADRVAKRREAGDLALAFGGGAQLARSSVVQAAEWLVALDALDPRGQRTAQVRLASAIQPDWILELFPDSVSESQHVRWDPKRERVEASWRLTYGNLVLEESAEEGDPERISETLRKAVRDAGPDSFCDPKELDGFLRRLAFARTFAPELPELDAQSALDTLCEGRRSFAELRQADLLSTLRGLLGYESGRKIDRLAPAQVVLAGGRRCEVHYETRQDPWIESRLQDFFGMAEGPTVANGQVSLVLHLRAPNKQAVSVTSDLAGFWERHYPAARKELGRRYPKHAWPEDPRTAKAPRPGRVR